MMLDIQELKEKALNEPDSFVLKPTGVIKLIEEIQRLRGMLHTERAQLAAQVGQERSNVERFTEDFCEDNCVSLYETEDCFAHAAVDYVLSRLYAAPPAPANSLAIVQAALEAAAHHIEGMGKLRSECAGFVSQPVSAVTFNYAKAIRAIDPQTILDGMTK